MTTDYNKRRLSESAHRITVSLDGVEPVTITLPYPILTDTINASLTQKNGIVDIVATKALHDVWPEDYIEQERSRWDVEGFETWTDKLDHESLKIFLCAQFLPEQMIFKPGDYSRDLHSHAKHDSVTAKFVKARNCFNETRKQPLEHMTRLQLRTVPDDWIAIASHPRQDFLPSSTADRATAVPTED